MDLTPNRQDLVEHLLGVLYSMRACARLEQRLSHSPHQSGYYVDLVNRLETLIDAERALNTRIQTVGR
jgi:hypothetical protein